MPAERKLWRQTDSSDWVHQSPSQPEKSKALPLQLLVLTKLKMTRRGKDADQMLRFMTHVGWEKNDLFDCDGLPVYELLEYIY